MPNYPSHTGIGPDAARSTPVGPSGHPHRWSILWILCGSLVLVVVSVSSLNVALPRIQGSLGATASELQWIVDAYALAFAALLLPAGAIGDRFGRKRALLAGLAVFGLSSMAGMLADTSELLILSRAVMGAGAALIMPATLSIITAVFDAGDRPRAIAIWAGFAGAGGVIGLISTGLLLEVAWWGSIFAINLPLVVTMLIIVAIGVPESRDPSATPLDPAGALLSMVALVAFVLGVIEGPEAGWFAAPTITAFMVAAVAVVMFVGWELRTDHPMLDPRFFRDRRFSLGSAVISVIFFGIFGMFFVVTQFLQLVEGMSPLSAGLLLLPYGLVLLVVSPRSAVLAARHGDRPVMVGGLTLGALGFAVLAMLEPSSPHLMVVVGQVLVAVGTGLAMPPATTAIVASLPAAKAGVGSAMNDAAREVGGAVGIAVVGALLSVGFRSGLSGAVDTTGLPKEALDSLGGLIGSLEEATTPDPASLLDAAEASFAQGLRLGMLTSAALLAAGGLVVAVLHPRTGTRAPEPTPESTTEEST